MNLFEKYREEFRQTVARMNVAIDHHDKNKNLFECGRLKMLEDILKDMGHKIEGRVIPDKDTGMQRAIFVMLDGESLGNFMPDNNKSLFEALTLEESSEEPDETEEKD